MASEVVVCPGGWYQLCRTINATVRRSVCHTHYSAEIGSAQPSLLVVMITVKLPTFFLQCNGKKNYDYFSHSDHLTYFFSMVPWTEVDTNLRMFPPIFCNCICFDFCQILETEKKTSLLGAIRSLSFSSTRVNMSTRVLAARWIKWSVFGKKSKNFQISDK